MAEPLTHFSVIVPVHNGAETLDDCLTALTGQDYPRECFEVIVVDDGSTDETARIAAKYSVRLISLGSNQGRIVARITGAQAARFETLVFNDARVTPERELLAKVGRLEYEPLIPDFPGSSISCVAGSTPPITPPQRIGATSGSQRRISTGHPRERAASSAVVGAGSRTSRKRPTGKRAMTPEF
jgi:hypothetical protein